MENLPDYSYFVNFAYISSFIILTAFGLFCVVKFVKMKKKLDELQKEKDKSK